MVTLNNHYANSNNSTQLVETVSIDYDDFNDNFLTCATCLCKNKCMTICIINIINTIIIIECVGILWV